MRLHSPRFTKKIAFASVPPIIIFTCLKEKKTNIILIFSIYFFSSDHGKSSKYSYFIISLGDFVTIASKHL